MCAAGWQKPPTLPAQRLVSPMGAPVLDQLTLQARWTGANDSSCPLAGVRPAPCRQQRQRRLRPCAVAGAGPDSGTPATRSVVVLPGLGNNSKVGSALLAAVFTCLTSLFHPAALNSSQSACPGRTTAPCSGLCRLGGATAAARPARRSGARQPAGLVSEGWAGSRGSTCSHTRPPLCRCLPAALNPAHQGVRPAVLLSVCRGRNASGLRYREYWAGTLQPRPTGKLKMQLEAWLEPGLPRGAGPRPCRTPMEQPGNAHASL